MKEYEINLTKQRKFQARAVNTTITAEAHANGTYKTKIYDALEELAPELAGFLPIGEEFHLYEETGRWIDKVSSDGLKKLRELVIKEHNKILSMNPDKT